MAFSSVINLGGNDYRHSRDVARKGRASRSGRVLARPYARRVLRGEIVVPLTSRPKPTLNEEQAQARLTALMLRLHDWNRIEEQRQERFVAARVELEKEIAAIASIVQSFSYMGERRSPPLRARLTSASELNQELSGRIESVLRAAHGRPVTTPEVRDVLVAAGFCCQEATSLLASIESSLQQLCEQGEVRRARALDGESFGWHLADRLVMRPVTRQK